MKALFCFALLLPLFPFHAHGQQDPLYKLELRKEVNQMPWRDSIYRFPHFLPGKITFEDNFTPDQTLLFNYNAYFGHLYLINSQGDTLQVKNYALIKMITIGGVNFVYDDPLGYIEVVTHAPVALGMQQNFIYVGEDMGLGKAPVVRSSTDFRGVRVDYTRVYKKGATYYFIDTKNMVHKALPNAIVRLFPTNKTEIKDWMKKQHIDFRKKEDLVRLLEFCNAKAATAQR